MANLVEFTKFVFDNFAVGVDEIVNQFGLDEQFVRLMLHKLSQHNIVTDHMVNDEDEVWQTWKTYDDHDWDEVEADLFEAFGLIDLYAPFMA